MSILCIPSELIQNEIAVWLDDPSYAVLQFVLVKILKPLEHSIRFDKSFYSYRPAFVVIFWQRVKWTLCVGAVAAHNIELLRWARTPKRFWNSAPWLLDMAPIGNALIEAGKVGNLAALKLLNNCNRVRKSASRVLDMAARYGHADVVEWCLPLLSGTYGEIASKCEVTSNIAIQYGHIDIVKQLRKVYNRNDITMALTSPNPDLVRMLIEESGCTEFDITWISDPNMIAFPKLVELWSLCPREERFLLQAISSENWAAVRWMLKHGYRTVICHNMPQLPPDIAANLLGNIDTKLINLNRAIADNNVTSVRELARNDPIEHASMMWCNSLEMYDCLMELTHGKIEPNYNLARIFPRLDIVKHIQARFGWGGMYSIMYSIMFNAVAQDYVSVVEWAIGEGYEMNLESFSTVKSIKMLKLLLPGTKKLDKFLIEAIRLDWLEGLMWVLSPVDIDGTPKEVIPFDCAALVKNASNGSPEIVAFVQKSFGFVA